MTGQANPLVSVIIPVYNGANFLAEAIESALAQTYPACEIIVVNDGSSDDGRTAAIARGYDQHIRYFEKSNGGVSSALNVGISKMRGKYFSWLSHDDVFHPLKTELQVSVAEQWGGDDVVVFCDYEVFSADRPKRYGVRLDDALMHSGRDGLGWRSLLRGHMNGCGLLIPRHLIDRYGRFDESQRITQDYDYWLRLLETVYFLHVPLRLVSYRLHDEQTTRTASLTEESEALWPRIAAATPPEKQVEISGSRYRFFREMANFFAERAACPAAAQWAVERADSLLEETSLSIVVLGLERDSTSTDAFEVIAAEARIRVEVLLVYQSSEYPIQSGIHPPNERGIMRRLGVPAAESPRSVVKRVMGAITTEYVMFVEAGEAIPRQHLARQVLTMQEHGWLACVAGGCGNPEANETTEFSEIVRDLDNLDLPQPSPSEIFHRSVVESCLASKDGERLSGNLVGPAGTAEAGSQSRRLRPEETPGNERPSDMDLLVDEILGRAAGNACVTSAQIQTSFDRLVE
ncbi:MAG: glycosyltransferase [Chitinophagaceae bacterium]